MIMVQASGLKSASTNIANKDSMVANGGGIPSDVHDIRFGDIMVSQPSWTSEGVMCGEKVNRSCSVSKTDYSQFGM